jgi:hypothetical protein
MNKSVKLNFNEPNLGLLEQYEKLRAEALGIVKK